MPARRFGAVRRLPSGRFQARYYGPDGGRHTAPATFHTRTDARRWLDDQHDLITRGRWVPPAAQQAGGQAGRQAQRRRTFASYATSWLAGRELKPRTRDEYQRLLDAHLLPSFGQLPLDAITPVAVREWHARLQTGPTRRAHAYALLRTIMGTAVADDLITANPCRIRGAGSTKRARAVQPASLAELAAIADASPDRFRALVLLSAWCGLRYGEATELRRADVDPAAGTLRIDRAVTRTSDGYVIGTPKSDAGRRTVNVPPHLLPALRDHLATHVAAGQDALLFPGEHGRHLAPASCYGWYYPARLAAGRPDLRWHDLRHTGAVLAAATGATLAELMHRLGHSTPQAAMIYQHAAADRDRAIADALSELATGTVVPLRRRHTQPG